MIPRGWQLVPIEPDHDMKVAFGCKIRRQAAKLDPGTSAHEPLAPLWAAVLAAAPKAVPVNVPHTTAEAWNAGVAALADIAQRSADALRQRLTERPTRFAYGIEALDAIVEAATLLTIPPEGPEPILAVALATVAVDAHEGQA